ncbi:Uncharacterised protein [uncultured archaeon]|nr:Uncharacterised protein [uncultured archaeon]
MAKVCIIHQKESDGIPVKDDIVLRAIRGVKKAFRASTGNQLVVCKAHVEEAKKRRAKFEKSLLTSALIGALFGTVMLVVSILSQRSIFDILRGILLLVFLVVVMAALSLYQYFPALEEGPQKKRAAKPTARAAKRTRR